MDKCGWVKILGFVGLVALGAAAQADTAKAAAAYKRGQAFQTAKQWGGAVKEYQAALKEDPKYFYAYKALGTTYYQAGDKKGALGYYDRYLAMNPSDAATKAFADKLRGELGGSAPASAAAAPAEAAAGPKTKFNSGLSVGLGGGLVMTDGSDVAKFYAAAPSTFKAPGGAMAMGGDLSVDYALSGGFIIGGALVLGPNRTHEVDNSVGASVSKQSFSAGHMGFFVSPGYRVKLGQTWWLEPRLGIGYLTSTLTTKFDSGTTASPISKSVTYSGSGFGAWPELRVVKSFGRLSLNLGLGYFWSSSGPFKDPNAPSPLPAGSSGNLQYWESSTATTPSDWMMSTTGVSLRLGLAYHFKSPV